MVGVPPGSLHGDGDGRGGAGGAIVVGRDRGQAMRADGRVLPDDAVGVGRIRPDQGRAGVEIHFRDRAIAVGGGGVDRDIGRRGEVAPFAGLVMLTFGGALPRAAFQDREVIAPRAVVVEILDVEPVAIHVEHERAQDVERNEHRGMIQRAAADLAGGARDGVNRARKRQRAGGGLRVGAGAVVAAAAGLHPMLPLLKVPELP